MIVVCLNGGLGNQLFQYALGRHLAEIHGTDVYLDLSALRSCGHRRYALGPFNIQEHFASPKEVQEFKFKTRNPVERAARWVLRRPAGPVPADTYVREKERFRFDPDMLRLPDKVYLEGSWQNEKYFVDIEETIRREFCPKDPPAGKNKELLSMTAECPSVSMHVRRGDFVDSPGTRDMHGFCNIDYYRRCVERIAQAVRDPRFFVFSDDIPWCREHLGELGAPTTLVDHNGPDKAHEDLRLMSVCKHNIIANSTFSWWGAWLNANREKVVLAPECWLKEYPDDPSDLIPPGWIRVASLSRDINGDTQA